MINKLSVLFSFLLLNGCMYDQFAQKTHFDLYRNSDGSYSFNYLQPRRLGQGFEMRQNLKNWTSAYRQCRDYKIVNQRSNLNYFIINGICLK